MSTPLRTYYNGPRGPMYMVDHVNQQTRYFHYDTQGTVQCLTDQTGAVTDRFACDAWGVQVKRTGSSINRHWYIGRSGYYRDTTGLDYVRARYLSARQGRWLSRDPLRAVHRKHLYVGNRPAAVVDPSGLRCEGASPQCAILCPPSRSCRNCDWLAGIDPDCRPLPIAPLPTSTCNELKELWQAEAVLDSLIRVAGALPLACRGGNPAIGGRGARPAVQTLCCEDDVGRCHSLYTFYDCRGEAPVSSMTSCELACLYEHEAVHSNVCERGGEPGECAAYERECECLMRGVVRFIGGPTNDLLDLYIGEICSRRANPARADSSLQEIVGAFYELLKRA